MGDDEVLQADSGTRTASIKGGSVATARAIRQWLECEAIKHNPIRHYVAAISVGIVDGTPTLDLRVKEDSRLQVDMNVVMTSNLEFAEVQATAEGRTHLRTAQCSIEACRERHRSPDCRAAKTG